MVYIVSWLIKLVENNLLNSYISFNNSQLKRHNAIKDVKNLQLKDDWIEGNINARDYFLKEKELEELYDLSLFWNSATIPDDYSFVTKRNVTGHTDFVFDFEDTCLYGANEYTPAVFIPSKPLDNVESDIGMFGYYWWIFMYPYIWYHKYKGDDYKFTFKPTNDYLKGVKKAMETLEHSTDKPEIKPLEEGDPFSSAEFGVFNYHFCCYNYLFTDEDIKGWQRYYPPIHFDRRRNIINSSLLQEDVIKDFRFEYFNNVTNFYSIYFFKTYYDEHFYTNDVGGYIYDLPRSVIKNLNTPGDFMDTDFLFVNNHQNYSYTLGLEFSPYYYEYAFQNPIIESNGLEQSFLSFIDPKDFVMFDLWNKHFLNYGQINEVYFNNNNGGLEPTEEDSFFIYYLSQEKFNLLKKLNSTDIKKSVCKNSSFKKYNLNNFLK